MSLKSFKTPLRYPGGKSRACKKMQPFFPDLRDYDVYYEPFLGCLLYTSDAADE